MSNNELIVRLCDLLRQCTDIIEAQSSLLSMHCIETFDGDLERRRAELLTEIAASTDDSVILEPQKPNDEDMTFAEAVLALESGQKVKMAYWISGYWEYDKKAKTILRHCADGSVIDFKKSDDLLFILSGAACNKWQIVKD